MSLVIAPMVFRRLAFCFAMCVSLTAAASFAPATANAAENEAEGRRLFKRGQELFVEGRYLEAAQAFETGYAAVPRTAFLINIAHSYRRAGELEKAKHFYLKLLELEPTTPQRAEVEANVKSIDDALALKDLPPPPQTKPAAKPVPNPDAFFRRRVAEENDDAALTVPAENAGANDSDEGGSVFGKAWFWAIVLTAAAGAGVAAFAISRGGEGCKELRCFQEMP